MCRPVSARPRSRTDTVAYPSFRFKLEAWRPIEGYPDALKHIGDHLLKRRLDLGMNQKTAAERLGTNAWSLRNWETNRRKVEARFYPAIIAFLKYNPLPKPATLGDAVRRERVSRGLSRKSLALQAGVDEATVKRLELDVLRMSRNSTERVLRLLGLI